MHKFQKKNKQLGFTIVELMTVVLIAGIMAMFAVPEYRNMVANNCLTTSNNTLVASFQQARSEAIKRRTNVTIAASGDWSTGWTITLDEDRDGDSTLDTGEDYDGDGVLDSAALVRTVVLTCTNVTVTEVDDEDGTETPSKANDTEFIYGSDGFIDGGGTFEFCDNRTGETGRQLSVSNTGRPNTNSNFTGCS